jgi:hypothetical protein
LRVHRRRTDNEISILDYEKSIYASSRDNRKEGFDTINIDGGGQLANFNADDENYSTKRRIT